jgi:hypothetical protein
MPHPRYLFLLLLLLCCCRPNKPHTAHAFYYWKSTYNFDSSQLKAMEQLQITQFYVHYFDVDWSENLQMPVPVAPLQAESPEGLFSQQYTPVVFITNRTFERMSDTACGWLADKVAGKIKYMTDRWESGVEDQMAWHQAGEHYEKKDSIEKVIAASRAHVCNSIQIDCDWTVGTKDKYFYFLKELKKIYKDTMQLSATIRLYPYKYADKMGVPPVNRGMLMCYNLGRVNDPETKNSILDINELKTYLTGEKYPLPLDVAVPVFGWYAWFRGSTFKGIVHDEHALADSSAFTKLDEQRYRLMTDTVMADQYYRTGDVFRAEYPSEETVSDALSLIDKKVPQHGAIVYYYWDLSSIKKYEEAFSRY